METTLIIIGLLCVLVGLVGSVLPVIPGPPISYIGLWLYHFSSKENHLSILAIVLFTFFTVLVSVLDYLIPAWGTKKFGGTKWGVWGSTLGLVAGLFFGPPGIILGPFFGAFIGETLNNQPTDKALKAAFGSFIGFIFGTGLKLILCTTMLVFYLKKTSMIIIDSFNSLFS